MAQAEPITMAKLSREELYQLLRAATTALKAGVLADWKEEDAETLGRVLMESLGSLRDAYRDDTVIGLQIGNAVLAAVSGRSTAYGGHTWGSLRAAIDRLIAPGDELASIEYGNGSEDSRHLRVERDEHGAVEIRGVRR